MTKDEIAAKDRAAVKLQAAVKALRKIEKESSYILDKGDLIGAGRRLERIHTAAGAALTICVAK